MWFDIKSMLIVIVALRLLLPPILTVVLTSVLLTSSGKAHSGKQAGCSAEVKKRNRYADPARKENKALRPESSQTSRHHQQLAEHPIDVRPSDTDYYF